MRKYLFTLLFLSKSVMFATDSDLGSKIPDLNIHTGPILAGHYRRN